MTPRPFRLLLWLTVALALVANTHAAGGSASAPTDSFGAALRVMSFNVRTSGARDGPNAWPLRRELLFEEIARFNPTLIGFQEVCADQHDEIVERMKDHAFVGVARDDGKRQGEWALVGYRRDRFDKVSNGDFWLSETPEVVGSKSWDAALTRICTWVRLRDRANGRELLFANTHFDHRGVLSREHAAKLLVLRLTELAEGRPIILTGDLNVTEDTPAYATITRRRGDAAGWLVDAYRVVHPKRQPDEATFHAFRGTRTGSRIDFVFHSPSFKPISATIERLVSPEGKYSSDHFAVTAVLEYGPAPAATAQ